MNDPMFDKHGLSFAEHRRKLPERASDFPRIQQHRHSTTVLDYRYSWVVCQVCGLPLTIRQGDTHHIIGGAGRSDEKTNLLRLCNSFSGCHDESWSVMLPWALWAKWKTDRKNLSWVRLAQLYGSFLPEPKPKGE